MNTQTNTPTVASPFGAVVENSAEVAAELLAVTRDLLSTHSGTEHVKAHVDAGTAHDPALWALLAETGLLGALVPEEWGGAGLTPAELSGVVHAFGEFAVAEPFLETAVLATAPLVAAAAVDPKAAELLQQIAEGQAVVAVDVAVPGAAAQRVAFAAQADALITVTDDDRVLLHTADEFRATAAEVLDPLRPLAAVELLAPGHVLDVEGRVAHLVRDRAVAGAAALLAGVGRRLVSSTVEYVSIRHQFGRPVGSFQAVKHKIADVAVKVDMAEAAALSAFEVSDETGPETTRRARAAKAYAGVAADLANVESLQLHGGIGFTWEYELHIWLKRAMSLQAAHGTATEHRRVLARELLAAAGGQRG